MDDREPWVTKWRESSPGTGRQKYSTYTSLSVALPGLGHIFSSFPWLTPWAKICRPLSGDRLPAFLGSPDLLFPRSGGQPSDIIPHSQQQPPDAPESVPSGVSSHRRS